MISKIDDYDREDTVEQLIAEISKGERSAKDGKAVPIGKVAKKFNVQL